MVPHPAGSVYTFLCLIIKICSGESKKANPGVKLSAYSSFGGLAYGNGSIYRRMAGINKWPSLSTTARAGLCHSFWVKNRITISQHSLLLNVCIFSFILLSAVWVGFPLMVRVNEWGVGKSTNTQHGGLVHKGICTTYFFWFINIFRKLHIDWKGLH